MAILGLRGVLKILVACGCCSQSEDECGYEGHGYRICNISSYIDHMVDAEAHNLLTLVVNGGCAAWKS